MTTAAFLLLCAPAYAGTPARPAATATAKPAKSLYARLGGRAVINAVVDDFAGRVLADTRINRKFARSDPARLVTNLRSFLCSAARGPCRYRGRSMAAAHRNMAVTEAEFAALVEDLERSLDKFNVPAREKGELLAALAPLAPEIVEVRGNAIGTHLPGTFTPAPPLKPATRTRRR
ncbi:MAG: group 1 truncated hemoglobin [Novosphingobium sp.]